MREFSTQTMIIIFTLIFISCGNKLSLPSQEESDEDNLDPPQNNETAITNPLMIVGINVGQGDATLIVTPDGHSLLIDGGPVEAGTNYILPLLANLGIDALDYLFVSHYDSDHIGGLSEVIAGSDGDLNTADDLTPDFVFDRGNMPDTTSETFENYLQAVSLIRKQLLPGQSIDFDDGVKIQCLIIDGQLSDGTVMELETDDENEKSMGLLITFNHFSYFTAGDLPGGGFSDSEDTVDLENQVAPLVGLVDVLHISHHGSSTSSSQSFLEKLSPTVSLISVGNENTYGHPTPTVLNRLEEIGSTIYQTEQGSGGISPSAYVLDDSIFIFVEQEGEYLVNGNEYRVKEK